MLNCDSVWRNLDSNEDLANDYYYENAITVLKSIVIGSVRLAAILDSIFIV